MQVTIHTDDGCRWLTAEYDSVNEVQGLLVRNEDVACIAFARSQSVDQARLVRFDTSHVVALSAPAEVQDDAADPPPGGHSAS